MELGRPNLLEVSADGVQKIRKIYNVDNPERLKETLDILEDWMKKQMHFVKRDFTRAYLEKTFIICKGSMERTKKQLDRSCTIRTVLPKFFTKTNVKEDLKGVSEVAQLFPLPKLTDNYYRVVLLRINDKPIQSHVFMEYYQYNLMLYEYMKLYDYINGFEIVADLRNVSVLEIVTKINTVELQQFISVIMDGLGASLVSVYLISESKSIELLVKILKQFLSQKIGGRIHVVPNLEELYKFVNKKLMPKDYGGNEKTTEELNKEWVEILSTKEHAEYMRMMNGANTDESQRPSAQFNEDYLGMPGSFRNLNVD